MIKNTDQIPGLDAAASKLVASKGLFFTAPKGAKVFEPGKTCELFYLLTKSPTLIVLLDRVSAISGERYFVVQTALLF